MHCGWDVVGPRAGMGCGWDLVGSQVPLRANGMRLGCGWAVAWVVGWLADCVNYLAVVGW
jgi:hypothetical protein